MRIRFKKWSIGHCDTLLISKSQSSEALLLTFEQGWWILVLLDVIWQRFKLFLFCYFFFIQREIWKDERKRWVDFDVQHGVRKKMVEDMKKQFPNWNLDWWDEPNCYFLLINSHIPTRVIGGQMGFDVFIKGWDKTFCLQYLDQEFKVSFCLFMFFVCYSCSQLV